MLAKINVSEIVRSHYGTLYDNRSERRSVGDMVLFLAVPAVVAILATIFGGRLGSTGSLLAAVSILGGFLFALLILVLQMSADAAARTEEDGAPSLRVLRRVRILREVSGNVAYSVLVSMATTVSLVVGDFVLLPSRSPRPGDVVRPPQQPTWISVISLFLLAHLSITLLMVLRRTYAIAQRELDFASVARDRDRVA